MLLGQRFFVTNARLTKPAFNAEFFLRNSFCKPVKTLQSSFMPQLRRRFATHRDLNLGGGNRGGSHWRAQFRLNSGIYKSALMFAGGCVAVNYVIWPYVYSVPGLDQLKRRPENLVYAIIGVNLAVLAAWRLGSGRTVTWLTNRALLHKDSKFHPAQMLINAFSHIGPVHLACNMFMLYQFGVPAAKLLGASKFSEIYMNGAVMSSLASIMLPLVLGRKAMIPSLGASGAVFTAFGMVTYLVPHLKVQIILLPIEMNGLDAFWGSIVVNCLGMAMRWGGIDWAGHIGGSMVAVAYGKYYQMVNEQKRRRSF